MADPPGVVLLDITKDAQTGMAEYISNNTNLAYAISDTIPDIGNVRETVFFSLMRTTQEVTTSSVADFNIGKYTFEIGGKNKAQKQIEGIENAYVVKDDIEYGYKNIIPLWAFGLTY